jgi:hypothetical protein
MSGNQETKWYVKGQGRTLGPLLTEELQNSIANHALSPEDEAVRKGEHAWRPLKELSDFQAVCEARLAKTRKISTPPPIGSIITKRLERRQERQEEQKNVTTPAVEPAPPILPVQTKQQNKLPARPALEQFETLANSSSSGQPKQAVALAQMMQELKEQRQLEDAILQTVQSPSKPKSPRYSLYLFCVLVVLATCAIFFRAEITRGLKSSRSSDPSPNQILSPGDPIYLPKAPVRPNRN